MVNVFFCVFSAAKPYSSTPLSCSMRVIGSETCWISACVYLCVCSSLTYSDLPVRPNYRLRAKWNQERQTWSERGVQRYTSRSSVKMLLTSNAHSKALQLSNLSSWRPPLRANTKWHCVSLVRDCTATEPVGLEGGVPTTDM